VARRVGSGEEDLMSGRGHPLGGQRRSAVSFMAATTSDSARRLEAERRAVDAVPDEQVARQQEAADEHRLEPRRP